MIIAEISTQITQVATQTGIGLGSAIAVVCSWQRNRSIFWAIVAGIISWFYVIYFEVTRRPEERRLSQRPALGKQESIDEFGTKEIAKLRSKGNDKI